MTCLVASSEPAMDIVSARQFSLDPYDYLTHFKRTVYSMEPLVQRMQLERQLKEHEGCVNCINFSHDGHLLASGSDDLHIILWDWAKGKKRTKFDSGHIANVFQAKFMPQTNDSMLVSAARDGQVRCHVLSMAGELVSTKKVACHTDSAHKLALEPDNPHVFLSCGEDGSVLQIDLREDVVQKKKILVCKNDKKSRIALYSIFIDPSDYNQFAISGRDQYARIYDRRRVNSDGEGNGYPDPLKKFCPQHLQNPESEFKRENITCLVYSHDGKELLCSYNDEDVYLFDTSHGNDSEYIKRYQGHRNSATVKGVNFFGLGSEYVVSGSDCGHVFLWDKEKMDIVQYFEGDQEGVVNCLEPHPHIPVLAVSGLDHDVKIFSPSATKLTDLDGLEKLTANNIQSRKEAAERTPDGYDAILSFIMRQYRRGLRERVGMDDNDSDPSDDSEYAMEMADSGDEEDGDSDEDGLGRPRVMRCRQS